MSRIRTSHQALQAAATTLIVIWVLSLTARPVRAQANAAAAPRPFAAGAFMLGGTRFDGPSSIAGLVGGYGYAALGRLLLGGESGGTVTHPGGSTARYGLMTIGYVAKTADQWQLYPYGGVGAGNLSANSTPAGGGFVTNVGLGVDVLSRSRGLGLVLGARVGYLFRFGDGHEGAAYAALTIGLGARVRHNAP